TEKNLWEYTSTEADVISVGELTHSVKALDISQKIIRREG
ncbi:nicotinate-nucleotide diphosphorylase (carboxylating), partial [Candidatus Woesearchaeota archaeon]|nr:nicotinate-nucleotide diphosphorylase (carboxylating) [Candidatus Woesearchaeota archaeon]